MCLRLPSQLHNVSFLYSFQPDPLFLSSLICQCLPFFPALHLTFLLQRKHFSLNSTTCYLGLKYPGLEKPQLKSQMLVPLTFYFLHNAQKHYTLALVCGCTCSNTCYIKCETALENRVHTNKRWDTEMKTLGNAFLESNTRCLTSSCRLSYRQNSEAFTPHSHPSKWHFFRHPREIYEWPKTLTQHSTNSSSPPGPERFQHFWHILGVLGLRIQRCSKYVWETGIWGPCQDRLLGSVPPWTIDPQQFLFIKPWSLWFYYKILNKQTHLLT